MNKLILPTKKKKKHNKKTKGYIQNNNIINNKCSKSGYEQRQRPYYCKRLPQKAKNWEIFRIVHFSL